MDIKEHMRHPVNLLLIAWGIGSILVYLLIPEDSELFNPVTYVFYDGACLASVAVIFMVQRFYGLKSLEGKVWFLIGLGILLWTVGEFIWTYYDYYLGVDPFPSAADHAYVAAYVPLALSFFYKASYAKLEFDLKKLLSIAVIVALITVVTVLLVVVPIVGDEGAVDSSGEPLDEGAYYSFTTISTGDVPDYYVVDEDGLEAVALNASLRLALDDDVDRASAEEYFYMVDESGEDVEGTVEWDGSTLVFTPDAPLEQGTFYEVEVYVGYGSLEKTYNLLYPLMDIVILALALFVAAYWGTLVSRGWYVVAAGMMLNSMADIAFSSLDWRGVYYYPVDLLWIFSYIFFALGALYQKKFHESFM